MKAHLLPTWNEILASALAELDQARGGLSESASWLRSDWRPVDTALSPAAGRPAWKAMRLIGQAKGLIDQAKGAFHGAWNGTGTPPRAE